jgi:SAM-dependent methyltransferase
VSQGEVPVPQFLSNRVLFTLTICVGSLLLFLVQPMIARMALPRLGGAPAVWNSAMLVYQALLLGGYAWAHWLGRFAPRRQAAIHLALFAVATLMLPIGLTAATPAPDANPFVWVPWLLLTSIGPLFFVVSAQAPLMQRWFALADGGDPYPLYAASNLGSFAGLIAYPLLVEPGFALAGQSLGWSLGYVLLLILVAVAAFRLPTGAAGEAVALEMGEKPTSRQITTWVVLAAIPSGLMLSTSLHLTTDIVAMPLLWVLPLGLYLLSFSVAFATRRGLADAFTLAAPIVLLAGGGTAFLDTTDFTALYGVLALALLFCVAVALHAEMFELRPAPQHLTQFYLAMSVGGVVGGLFCALVAPLVFDWSYEHALLILAAACTLRHRPLTEAAAQMWEDHGARLGRWIPVIAFMLGLYAAGVFPLERIRAVELAAMAAVLVLALLSFGRRIVFAACVFSLMLGLGGYDQIRRSLREGVMTRSFFGIYTVLTDRNQYRQLVHGTTMHGMQHQASGRETEPLSYYAPRSGVGLALKAAPELFGPAARIGAVGLGTGTLACYSRPGQSWRFYEIDPAVEGIARDPSRFTYLSRCNPGIDIAIGDARLVIAGEPPASFDMFAIDAFSSDSVPIHLLTREAFDTYGRALKPGGLLMVHISNRYLKLEPVVAEAARLGGWHASVRFYLASEKDKDRGYSTSHWIALSRDPDTIARLKASSQGEEWRPIARQPGFRPWTDDYASIIPVLYTPWNKD